MRARVSLGDQHNSHKKINLCSSNLNCKCVIHSVYREHLYSSWSSTTYSRACYLGDRTKGQFQRERERAIWLDLL